MVVLFEKPEELIKWLDRKEVSQKLTIIDACVLFKYLKSHNYAVGVNDNGDMIRKDMVSDNGTVQEYSINELINCVCRWNQEAIAVCCDEKVSTTDLHAFAEWHLKYEEYKRDESCLYNMFLETPDGQRCEKFARELADELVALICKKIQRISI